MKYISFAIVIIFICVVVGFWLKGTPKTEVPAPVSSEVRTEDLPVQTETTPTQETVTTDNTKNKITTIQGMKIETTKQGSGPEIKNGQTAVMKYTGKLENGTVFDATDKHGGIPFEFSLGAGQVIKGWDLGVLGMKVGEKRTFTIPSDLGYGAGGIPGVIPGGATLIFDVELVGIK